MIKTQNIIVIGNVLIDCSNNKGEGFYIPSTIIFEQIRYRYIFSNFLLTK